MIPLIGSPEDGLGLMEWNRARQSRDPKIEKQLARMSVLSEVEALKTWTIMLYSGTAHELTKRTSNRLTPPHQLLRSSTVEIQHSQAPSPTLQFVL